MTRGIALLVAAGAVGCSGELSTLDGIYEIRSWTESRDGCDAEGASILESRDEPYFAVVEQEFFGTEYLWGNPCADLPACRELSDGDTVLLFGWTFPDGNDDDGWRGYAWSAYPLGDRCGGLVVDLSLASAGDGAVRLERRSTDVPDFAPDDGECEPEDAAAAAEDLPCTGLEVLTAELLETF